MSACNLKVMEVDTTLAHPPRFLGSKVISSVLSLGIVLIVSTVKWGVGVCNSPKWSHGHKFEMSCPNAVA